MSQRPRRARRHPPRLSRPRPFRSRLSSPRPFRRRPSLPPICLRRRRPRPRNHRHRRALRPSPRPLMLPSGRTRRLAARLSSSCTPLDPKTPKRRRSGWRRPSGSRPVKSTRERPPIRRPGRSSASTRPPIIHWHDGSARNSRVWATAGGSRICRIIHRPSIGLPKSGFRIDRQGSRHTVSCAAPCARCASGSADTGSDSSRAVSATIRAPDAIQPEPRSAASPRGIRFSP